MFSKAVLVGALAALAAAQSSVLTFTNVPNPVTDGQPQAITYATNDTSSPVTILLRKGPSTDLQTVDTLTESATGGQYIWTPPVDLPNGNDYALQITQGDETNYFGPFVVQGASASSGSSSSASASGAPTNSANSTTSAPVTPPAPIGTAPPGTGVNPPRNTTMSSATLTAPTSTATVPAGTGSDDASGTGANPTESADASESTGGASSFSVASGIALFGAIAAGIFLQ